MSKFYDEELNKILNNLGYAIAEKEILKAVVATVEKTDDCNLLDNFNLKQLLDDSFEEAMKTVYGNCE